MNVLFHRITSIYIGLLFSIFLLAFPPSGYVAMAEFKYALFLFICGGYCFLMITIRTQLAIVGDNPIKDKAIRQIPMAMKLLFLMLLMTVVSAVFSVHPGTFIGMFRQEGVLTVAIYVFCCFLLSIYFCPKKWMLFLLGASTCLFCLLALVQLTGANPFLLYPEGLNYFGAGVYYPGEFLSTLGNAGLGGAFLSVVSGVFLMALIKLEFNKKWILAVPLFLTVLLIFEMNIDAALLAFGVGFLIMLSVSVSGKKDFVNTLFVTAVIVLALGFHGVVVFGDGVFAFRPSLTAFAIFIFAGFILLLACFVRKSEAAAKICSGRYRTGAVAFAVCVICFALIYIWFFGEGHIGVVYEVSQVMRGRWDDTFGSRRVFIWRNVLEQIQIQNLLLGTGADTLGFWDIEPFYRLSGESVIIVNIDTAHNEYLHMLATNGLLALLSYLGALIIVMVQWFRFPDNKISAVAGAGVLFYCIQAFFGISMPISAPFFWACLGVLIYSQRFNGEGDCVRTNIKAKPWGFTPHPTSFLKKRSKKL